MRLARILIVVAAAGLAAGSPAWAEAPEKPEGRGHGQRAGHAKARFKRCDTDNSGTLSRVEFAAMHDARLAKVKERLGDRWDPERAAKRPGADKIFDRLDSDGSGDLSPAELRKGHRRAAGKRKERREKRRVQGENEPIENE